VHPNETNDLVVPGEQSGADQGLATPSPDAGDFVPDPSFDPLAGAGEGRKVHGGLILIVAVVLTAMAGLFSMRKLAEVTAAAGVDAEIEATIESFLSKLTKSGVTGSNGEATSADAKFGDTVLAVITTSYAERQVPLRDVQRDPFVIDELDAAMVDRPGIQSENPVEREARERESKREARRQSLVNAGESLELKSIMGGTRPMALLEGAIVSVGDTVTTPGNLGSFVVKSIMSASVDLVAEDPELDLVVQVTVHLQR
jgi:hypothetical protein